MKSSRIFKGGTILLVIALAVGIFAFVVWADGNGMNGTYGIRRGSSRNIESPKYGMQNKEISYQLQNQDCEGCEDCGRYLGNGMVNRDNAPDDDGDGIPNGQDSDYILHNCDEECDGSCDGEPKGYGMRRNSSDSISGLQTHISGIEMKTMTVSDIADLWGINADDLLEGIKNEFKLSQSYNLSNTLDDLRGEYRFLPYQIMEIAERIKTAPIE